MPFDESPWTPQGHLSDDVTTTVALGHAVAPDVAAHLADCAACRAEVDAWTRLVVTARSGDAVEPVEPRAGTWERIALETGLDPVAGDPATPPVTSGPVVVPLAARARRASTRPRRRWLPVAAAAVVGLGVGIVGGRVSTAPDPAPAQVVVVSAATLEPLPDNPSGPDTGGPAAGTAEVTEAGDVRRLDLAVSGVSEPADGFLEAWLLDADGGLVSLGAVSGGAVSVVLPPDLDLTRFDVVDVSRESFDGDPGHSADSLLRGVLDVPT